MAAEIHCETHPLQRLVLPRRSLVANALLLVRRVQERVAAQASGAHEPGHRRERGVPRDVPVLVAEERAVRAVLRVRAALEARRLVAVGHHPLRGPRLHELRVLPLLLDAVEVRLDAVRLQPVEAKLLEGVLRLRVRGDVVGDVRRGLALLEAVPEGVAVLWEEAEGLRLVDSQLQPAVRLRREPQDVPRVVRPGAREVLAEDLWVLVVELHVDLVLRDREVLLVALQELRRLRAAELLEGDVPRELAGAPAVQRGEDVLVGELAVVQLHGLAHEPAAAALVHAAVHRRLHLLRGEGRGVVLAERLEVGAPRLLAGGEDRCVFGVAGHSPVCNVVFNENVNK